MSRTSTDYDPAAVDVVTRTLHAVADATPVGAPAAAGLRLDRFPSRADAAVDRRALDRRRAAVGAAALATAAALVVGVVLARRSDDGDQAVNGVAPTSLPSHRASRIVTQGDAAGLRYALRWDERVAGRAEAPCLTFVVDGEEDDATCGMDATDVGRLATAAVTDDVALVWGYFGRDVRYVDGSDGTSAETLPVDPDDTDGLRYAVLVVARGAENPVMFDFMAESGELLGYQELDMARRS